MLRQSPTTKRFSSEIRHRTFERVHLSMDTTVRTIAVRREVALQLLLDTGEPVRDLVAALRARKLTIQAVEECVRAKLPFDTLRPSTWPTLADGRGRHVKHLEQLAGAGQGSANNARGQDDALAHAERYFGGDARLESITPEQVAGYRAHLSRPASEKGDDGRPGAGLSQNTVALYLLRFGALYTFLQQREAIAARQAKRAPAVLFAPLIRSEHMPPRVKTRVRFLSEDEAERLITAAPARLRLMIALGVFAGLRLGEARMLRKQDVDLELGMLFVHGRDGWTPKYRKDREIPISSALAPFLAEHLDRWAGTVYLVEGETPGAPFGDRSFDHHFRRMLGTAGLAIGRADPQGVTYHTLRHTFASWLVMEGVDLLTVARLMGHATIDQVQQTYGHLSPEHRRAAVEHLASRWAGRAGAAIAIPETGNVADREADDVAKTPSETLPNA